MNERARRAFLIAVGDELLAGVHADENSPELARRLAPLGLTVVGVRVLPDEEGALARGVRTGLDEADLVLVTGGLGPTLDDVTREGVARALGRELVTSDAAVRDLERWFDRRGVPMGTANLRQALIPEGARLVHNRVGTAPGFSVADDRGAVVCLPGPPREMGIVFEEEVAPWLIETGRAHEPGTEVRFPLANLSESVFAERVGAWMERGAEPEMGCTVKQGVLTAVLRSIDTGRERIRMLELRAEEFRARFREHIVSEEEGRLERVLGNELMASERSITFAESCTGGLVSALLTSVPGISSVFERGFVVYSDAAKERELGVPAEVLRRHGAVSSEVAEALALGARASAGSDLAVSVTGIAGPDGGSEEKPVGLVWFGVADADGVQTSARRFPPGERSWIRSLAARHALFLAIRRLRGEPLP